MTAGKRSQRDAARGEVQEVAPFFASSLDHVLAELGRIDLKIRARVSRSREAGESKEPYEGLFISELEVESLLSEPFGLGNRDRRSQEPAQEQQEQESPDLSALEQEIAKRRAESRRLGIELRLDTLADLFHLTPFDADVLLVCLVHEIDLRYERIYAYLQDDVTKRRPSVDLVLSLLSGYFEDRIAARERFSHMAPLFHHRLVSLIEDPAGSASPLLARFLKADDRVVDYLLGSDVVDGRLRHHVATTTTAAELEALPVAVETMDRLSRLVGSGTSGNADRIFYFQGPYGVGKRATAEALCRMCRCSLLEIDGASLLDARDVDLPLVMDLIEREAKLQNAALYWSSFDRLLADDMVNRFDCVVRMLKARRGLTVLAGGDAWEPNDRLRGKIFNRLEFSRPGYSERMALWKRALVDTPVDVEVDLEALAGQFRLTGGQIADSVNTGRNLACWRDPENGVVGTEDLRTAARLHSNRKLASLAQKIVPRYRWNDIVLPLGRLRQLQDIFDAAKCSPVVYGAWGFGEKLSLGKGLSVLFSGPSGTGKTMAAEILAGSLGLDLYKIDLSSLVSKYIGETEKNLARVFAEAETANAILFFDEADALFGKRSEVRDAHDRYANIEISYLLQRMEAYEGLVILATNLSKNMDEAFIRRLHFVVEFPFPSAADRRRIWDGVWPANTPRCPDLDLDLIARRFEFTGGNIKNIALAAAFMAAADGGTIGLDHLLRATQREYQKLGKVVVGEEFERHVAEPRPQ